MARYTALAAAFILSACSITSNTSEYRTQDEVPASAPNPEFTEEYAWENACRISGYECETVEPPKVEIRQLDSLGGKGVRGAYYWGSDTVLLDADLEPWGDVFMGVLIHEMIHYLQHFAPDRAEHMTRCQRENEAWNVGNIWHLEQGNDDLIIRNWWRAYNGCGPQGRTVGWPFPF